jgi:hypothetical protein
MATSAPQGIPTEKFLLIAINLLHRHFVEAQRATAKRLFQEIRKARPVAITSVTMEDNSTIPFQLSLDCSEVTGQLNFSGFKAGLMELIRNISLALNEQRQVKVFSQEHNAESLLFGISGVTEQDGATRVLALGADVSVAGGPITLQLMYLDPAQLKSRQGAAGPAPA